jgi:acyl-CoA synthetase (AMP-forming)/AMP-acid ligase II
VSLRRNLGSVLHGQRDAAATALIDLSGPHPIRYTYGELRRRSAAVAAALQREVGAGTRVGMLCGNSARFLVAYLGALQAGCTAVPYNPRAGAESIAHVCGDAQLELLFVDGPPPAGVPPDLATMDLAGAAFEQWWSGEISATTATPDGPALVLYTSGSTGRPKGVVLSHASQLAILAGLDSPGLRALLLRGPTIVAAPLFHMNGLIVSQLTFALGGTAVLMRRFDASAFLDAVAHHRVSVVSGVPTMIALLAAAHAATPVDLSSVERVLIGSAPLSEAILAQAHALFPRASVTNSYGTTEIGAGIFGAHPRGVARPELSIGYPAAGVGVRLVGGASADEGVLEVRSPTAMDGYLNLPDVTAAKVREGWVNTGDVFRRDADGFLYFVGRADDMFVCGGENVYPGEVERVIEQHPAVLQAAVVPLDDATRGQIPVTFVVIRPGQAIAAQELKEFVLARAAPHLHPRHVWFLDRLPLSAANKVDRQALQAEARERACADASGRPSCPATIQITAR